MNGEIEFHKTVRDLAVKYRLSVRREQNGHYYLVGKEDMPSRYYMSLHPTAKSGVKLIRRYLRFKTI